MHTSAPPLASLGVALALAGPAFAGSISGQIQDVGGIGIPGLTYLYTTTSKGWGIAATTNTTAAGNYTFGSLNAGDYKVFTRPGSGAPANLADRWYDAAAPNSGGWIAEDADVLTLATAGSTLTGINIQLPAAGGIDGHVRTSGGTMLAGMWARAQWRSDGRYHHNDESKGSPHSGLYSMRGLVPGDFLFIVYDAAGVYATTVFPGPYTVTTNNNLALGDFVLPAMPADPNGSNNSPLQGGASVDGSGLHADPPQPFITNGAAVAPRNADIDWYCFDAVVGDHFRLRTTTNLTVLGAPYEHPWVDPVIGWWSNGGTTLATWADDASASLNPDLEVWVTSAGRHCAVVSTYGDTGWNGSGQTSAGQYVLRIDMLNRRPLLALTSEGAPTPLPPGTLVKGEGQDLVIDLAFEDPDGDALTVTYEHTDALAAPVVDGVLVVDAPNGTAQYTWTIPNTGAEGSPYTLVFTVEDAEFDATGIVIVEVTEGNVPPPVPVPIAPPSGSVIATASADLVVETAEDLDGTPYEVEFQVLYGDTVGAADQTTVVPAVLVPGGVGQTTWTTAAMPENAVVFWRARGYDGEVQSPYSPWSAWQMLRIDLANDNPPAPTIFKPAEGELALTRRPTLSALTVEDPDGDALSYVFQVASDQAFTDILAVSPDVPGTAAPASAWRLTVELDWDTEYYARVSAHDARGGDSDFGEWTAFRTKRNVIPSEPAFIAPEAIDCGSIVFRDGPPSEVTLAEVFDPEGDAVTLEVEVIDAPIPNEPESAPYTSGDAAQVPGVPQTDVSFDGGALPEDRALRFRARAVDSLGETGWTFCDFWIDSENGAPGESTIVSPTAGQQLAAEDDAVRVEVTLGADPETAAGVAGAWVTLAYCITRGASADCPADPSAWPRLDPSEITGGSGNATGSATVEPVAIGDTWTVSVCTMDDGLLCGASSTVTFEVVDPDSLSGVGGGCGCRSGAPGAYAWTALLVWAAFTARRRRRSA